MRKLEAEAGEDSDEEQVDLWLEIPRVNAQPAGR